MKNRLSISFALVLSILFIWGIKTPFYNVTRNNLTGDTIQYYAKAFVIQPNDNLEDLLKRLPNVAIDNEGNIYAQGDTVKKILVDNEEFFGDSPALTTRNIRADKAEVIQFYYKISDQGTFTGIEDKIRIKVINIILKKDKKIGFLKKRKDNAMFCTCCRHRRQQTKYFVS